MGGGHLAHGLTCRDGTAATSNASPMLRPPSLFLVIRLPELCLQRPVWLGFLLCMLSRLHNSKR